MYDAAYAFMGPARAMNDALQIYLNSAANLFSETAMSRSMTAASEMFERATRRYKKPVFGLRTTLVDGQTADVTEEHVWHKPFCNLLHFKRSIQGDVVPAGPTQPKVLICAPMSGHYATLLRGTVEAFLPAHDVYITDWIDARDVPLAIGKFDLNDYIDYVIGMIEHLGPDVHVMAVCQPAVPVIAAIAYMEANGNPKAPLSMTLMGGPIDTRESPTAVNKLAEERGIDWFRKNCIVTVPFPHAGVFRNVYPGFLQLSGFMAMNIDRHLTAHWDMYQHLVQGDGESADKKQDFYDEYMAVMDMTAEFYLQTVDTVFVKHALPKGEMVHHGQPIDLLAIRNCALMTVEGENDDISGVGQTRASHHLCANIPADKHLYHLQKGVGHYGVFNGSRFRKEIVPAIAGFMRKNHAPARSVPRTGKVKLVSSR
ncbi:MAG: polyhydroxyalkanoate depolymerase [Beijerinckiaceae bacterium]|nr:polyhydroxyalkanoate depolymerase [Beijerinckiaceae bacterium]